MVVRAAFACSSTLTSTSPTPHLNEITRLHAWLGTVPAAWHSITKTQHVWLPSPARTRGGHPKIPSAPLQPSSTRTTIGATDQAAGLLASNDEPSSLGKAANVSAQNVIVALDAETLEQLRAARSERATLADVIRRAIRAQLNPAVRKVS